MGALLSKVGADKHKLAGVGFKKKKKNDWRSPACVIREKLFLPEDPVITF